MENTSINHNTRLYISDDAPHQGANVPEGYQHLARHARGLYIRAGLSTIIVEIIQLIRGRESPIAALSLADQPASKQILINFVNGNNIIDNSVHNAWQTELKNLGYPNGFTGTPFRKVAVSNGSECAIPQAFGPGANLLTYSDKANTRILGDLAFSTVLRAVPILPILLGQPFLFLGVIPGRNTFNFDFYINAQADGSSNQVYHGKITYTKSVLYLVPVTVTLTNRNYSSNAATLPYDYFPGGYYNLKSGGFDLSNSSNQNVFFKYSITASNQPTFNFVPTVSALDIGSNNVTLTKTDYLTRYIGANPPAVPKNTPFQNFITAFNNDRVNEQHISIEVRNGDWIAAELNSQMPLANCSSSCDLSTISGDASFCTTSNPYLIPNLPAGSTVYWSASPSIVQFSCNPCSQTVLTKTGNGNITLTASITTTNTCGTITIAKPNIAIGTPPTPTIKIDNIAPYPNTQMDVEIITTQPGPYNWYVDNVLVKTTSLKMVTINGGGCGNHNLRATVSNTCGATSSATTLYNRSCGMFSVSPNPATDDVTISSSQPATQSTDAATNTTTKRSMIYQVIISDELGSVKKQYKYSAGVYSTEINLGGLVSGAYDIQIFNGANWESIKIIKQ